MSGDQVIYKTLHQVMIQQNGIIREPGGYAIGRLTGKFIEYDDLKDQGEGFTLTWRLWFDCFTYLLHGLLRRHRVYVNPRFYPFKPMCQDCGR